MFDFVNSNNVSEGRLKVVGASGSLDGKTLAANANLVTINELNLNSNLANGEELELKIEDFEIVTSVEGNLTSNKNKSVADGKITIGSANTLELLSAQAIDSTTVKLSFSDYITAAGSFTITPALTNTAQIDPDDGKAVILTTAQQTKGTLYTVTASSTTGNTQGSINSAYNTAYFTGKEAVVTSSNFHLT